MLSMKRVFQLWYQIYNAQTLDKHIKSTEIIGELTGQKDRAAKIAKEYKDIVEHIQTTVKNAKLAKQPKVYVEFGRGGPAEQGMTFSLACGAL